MCGIYGIYNLEKKGAINKDELTKMGSELPHRGPDDSGIFVSQKVGLGYSRLSIIDRTIMGNQPFSNEYGSVWVVLNGEIYNYIGLRQDLIKRSHIFRSNSDTEVLVHLYEEYGEDFIKKLRGMFAFALWDANKRQLIIARDRMGQKPLVYAKKDDFLYFASEIKALRCISKLGKELDDDSVLLYYSFKLPIGEKTMFKDIKRLAPGKYMVVKDNEISIKTYWSPNEINKLHTLGGSLHRQLFNLLDETVSMQMASDVPVGAFLSGGVDSSTVVGLMTKNTGAPIKTFSIAYEANGAEDTDSYFAKEIAKLFKAEHRKIEFDPLWIDSLEKVVSLMDEPYSNQTVLSFYFLCKAAKEDVTVILSGDGGDEVFAGYSGYANWKLIDRLSCWLGLCGKLNLNSKIIKKLFLSGKEKGKFIKALALLLVSNSQKRGLRRMSESSEIINKLFTPELKGRIEYGIENRLLEEVFNEIGKDDFIDATQLSDLLLHNSHGTTWMPDQIGMANSLEIRAPFLDHKLIEFVFSLPSSMRIKGLNNRKYLLKKSLKGFIPDEVLGRRKIGYGENIPYRDFFRRNWDPFVKKVLFSGVLEKWGGINTDYVKRLYQENLLGEKDHFNILWPTLVLSIWLDKVYGA